MRYLEMERIIILTECCIYNFIYNYIYVWGHFREFTVVQFLQKTFKDQAVV